MKRSIFLTAIALMISAGIMAQSTNQVQTQNENRTRTQVQTQVQNATQVQSQTQNQTQVQNQDQSGTLDQTRTRSQLRKDAAETGQTVRARARNTESGPGKGAAVSQQAKVRGETQQARKATQNSSARSRAVQRNAMRMSRGTGSGRR
jgi:hypothetical protein